MRVLFSPAPLFRYFPTVVTVAMFHTSTGESLRWYKFPNRIVSSAHREHRHMMSVFPAEAIQLTSSLGRELFYTWMKMKSSKELVNSKLTLQQKTLCPLNSNKMSVL